jgi:hypothetical protein
MNAQQFKKLIKEAVRDAVREELRAVLSENQQPLQEQKTFAFTSNDVMKGGLPQDARNSLRAKMGMEFGFQQPQLNELKIINAVDEMTGEKVNPFSAFIADAAANMSAMDRSGLRNLD